MNAQLPFNNGVQYAWDSTSLGWLKTCPRLYEYHMIQGWSPKGRNVHLEFGQLYHSALEKYDHYRVDGDNHEDALRSVVQWLLLATWDDEQGKPVDWAHATKSRYTLVRSVVWYLEEFKHDVAETVILANGKPAVELSFRFEVDRGLVLCGHLDRVVRLGGDYFVADRKTTGSTIGTNYFAQFEPDNQMSLYTIAAQVIYSTPVKGVLIDAAQVAVGFTRFARGFTHRTPDQLEEWLADTKHWVALAGAYANRGHYPMNDKACHVYGGCTFRDVCSKSPHVREKFLESNFVRRTWNPLEVR